MNFPDQSNHPFSDFRNFLYVVWKHLGLPDPTPVQYDIAHFLQHGPRRKVIEAFRGVGKSWITSAYVCWLLLMNPDIKILVVSASKERADNFTTFTLRLIYEMPILQHLIPREGQRNSRVSFDVGPARADHAPSVKSVGITGQLAGSRADVIVADDIEVPNNSATQLMREKLAEAIKEFDAILKPDGEIDYLGTPQTEESIYNLLPERGYRIKVWPARYPAPAVIARYGDRLAEKIVDDLDRDPTLARQPTDPKRFTEFDLMERELSYGRSGFALQFMLDTSLSDADRYPLKLQDLVVMHIDPDVGPQKVVWAAGPEQVIDDLPSVGFTGDKYYRPMEIVGGMAPYTGSVMAIDPSGRGKDETSYAVTKMLNSQIFVPECSGYLGAAADDDILMKLVNTAKLHRVNKIIVEENMGQGMFPALLRPLLREHYPCHVEEVRHSKQKELRIIETLEPVMNQHRLIVDRRLIERDYRSTKDLPPEKQLQYQLFYQMTRITRDRNALVHDDRLDALSMAVAYWADQMAARADEEIEKRRRRALDEELRMFRRNFNTHRTTQSVFKPRGRSWINTRI